jgi:hypothetical protein
MCNGEFIQGLFAHLRTYLDYFIGHILIVFLLEIFEKVKNTLGRRGSSSSDFNDIYASYLVVFILRLLIFELNHLMNIIRNRHAVKGLKNFARSKPSVFWVFGIEFFLIIFKADEFSEVYWAFKLPYLDIIFAKISIFLVVQSIIYKIAN